MDVIDQFPESVPARIQLHGPDGAVEEMMTVMGRELISGGTMRIIASFAIGSLLGEWINLEKRITQFGEWLKVDNMLPTFVIAAICAFAGLN